MVKKSLKVIIALCSLVMLINCGKYRVSADNVEPDTFSGLFRTDVYAGSGLSSTGLKYSNGSYNLVVNPIENHNFSFSNLNNDYQPVARNFSVTNSRNYNIALTSFDFYLGFSSDLVPDPSGYVYCTLPFFIQDHTLSDVSTDNSFYYATVYDATTDSYSQSLGSLTISTTLVNGFHAIVLKIPFSEFDLVNNQYVFTQDSDLDLFITGRFSSVKNEHYYYFLDRRDILVRFDEKIEVTPPEDPPDDSDTNSLLSSLLSSVTGGFSNVLAGITGLSDDISDLGEYIVSNIGSFFDTAGQIFQSAGDLILGGLTSLGNSIMDFLRDPLGSISGLLQSILSYFGSFWTNLSGLLNSLMSGIAGMINELGNAIGNLGNLLIGDPGQLFDTFESSSVYHFYRDFDILAKDLLISFTYTSDHCIITIPSYVDPISNSVLWSDIVIDVNATINQIPHLRALMTSVFSFMMTCFLLAYSMKLLSRVRSLIAGSNGMEVE